MSFWYYGFLAVITSGVALGKTENPQWPQWADKALSFAGGLFAGLACAKFFA